MLGWGLCGVVWCTKVPLPQGPAWRLSKAGLLLLARRNMGRQDRGQWHMVWLPEPRWALMSVGGCGGCFDISELALPCS